jgi:uncharacterized membrane protein
MNSTTASEIRSYLDEVRAALADLPPTDRDELLEDLPDHLATVLADDAGSLRERLGEPAAYASELRAAAGMGAAAAPAHEARNRWRERWVDLDRRVGLALGYGSVSELMHALRPGWWVVRGVLAAIALLVAVQFRPDRPGFLLVFLVTAALVAASIRLGVATHDMSAGGRRVVVAGSLVLILLTLSAVEIDPLW